MARHKVEICGVNTADIKVLTNEEQMELLKKFQNGDPFAKEDLIKGNLKLVLSILKKFSNRVDNMDDLFQVGCIGLIKAIDNFSLEHEVRFSTYAVPMILGEIKRYLRDNNSVRISRSIKDTAYKANKVKEELTNEFGKEPSIHEIAVRLNLTDYEVGNALESMKDTISMFEPIYNDGGDTIYLADQLEDKKREDFTLDIEVALKDAINNLKEKEKYIITERYLIGKTQMELASEIGISQAQISRLEKSGLENIKKMMQ
ncbi:MAG: SigB/SigF/SigG family RNA polymerase sigma factor [Bacilli bacterium]|nr:SigB/SigF/SigG family RNA polymerase sigma factor [Bacilli bacterium]